MTKYTEWEHMNTALDSIEMERPLAISFLKGSRNYNLNIPESDYDFEMFTVPTYDDLYHHKYYNNEFKDEGMNIEGHVHDIRRLPELIWKSNPCFLEILHSKYTNVLKEEFTPVIRFIIDNKTELTNCDLKRFWYAGIGIIKDELSGLQKGQNTESIERYGYDTKRAMHAFRMCTVLSGYCNNGFKNLGKVIRYKDNDAIHDHLMYIRNGNMPLDAYMTMIENAQKDIEHYCKDKYVEQSADMSKVNELDDLLKGIIKEQIKGE